MKIINKILAALVAIPLVAGLASCSEKEADYSAAALLEGQEVYFSNSLASTVECSTEADVAYVELCRVKDADEITVPMKVTSTSADIKPATSVKFAAGEKVGKLAISYDPAKIEAGKYDTITVAIDADEYTTPYGKSSVTLLVGQAEPWTSIGIGTFNETWWFESGKFDVEIFQNQLKPNTYRMKNPFVTLQTAWEWPVSSKASEYLYFQVLQPGDEILGQTIDSEGLVYFYSDFTANSVNTGYTHSSYNDDVCLVFPGAFTDYKDPAFWSYNCVLAYQEDGSVGAIQLAPYYYMFSVGGWDNTQYDGLVIIEMPGYTLADYSASIEYTGKFTDTQDAVSAVVNVELGDDVASAKIGMFPGKASDEGLSSVMENGAEISAGGEYKIAFPEDAETGTYTVYVVSYDADDEAQDYSYEEVKYVAPGTPAEEQLTWTPAYVGTWEYSLNAFCNEDGTPYYDEGLVMSVCDQHENMYKISHLWYDVDFVFTLNEDGTINFEDQFTGANYGYGDLWAFDPSQFEGYEDMVGKYENGVFTFAIYYGDDEYNWGLGYETFTLTGAYTGEEAARAAKKATARKSATEKKLRNRAASRKVSNGVKKVAIAKAPLK